MNDITVIYYTANYLDDKKPGFLFATRLKFLQAIGNIPLIIVSQKECQFKNFNTENIIVGDIGRTHLNIYRQALIGAERAKTKYIALCEDDVLYHASHFEKRPSSDDIFAYNKALWSIYTWIHPALFSYKDRRNLSTLICDRELFIEAMKERFTKVNLDTLFLGNWSEPGKYEKNLGVTERKSEVFYTDIPLIAYSHETALSFENLGKRKKLGDLRVTGLPYWGSAEEILRLYE